MTEEDEHRSSHMIPFPSMWQLGFGVQGSAIKGDIAAAGVTVISLVWLTNNRITILTSFITQPTHWTYLFQSFQNYAINGWFALENMKSWLFILTKRLFLMTLIMKLTLGNIFIKVKNPPGGTTITK